jgi:dolichyl-phosphate beta-glucosyltransferase
MFLPPPKCGGGYEVVRKATNGSSEGTLVPNPTTIHIPAARDVGARPRDLIFPLPSRTWSELRPRVDLEVVIPALNEEARLPGTLARTLEYLSEQPYSSAVVVVDNGSVDGTAEVARSFMGGPVPVHLIGCAARGKGRAVRRGFATGRSRFVGFMDADLATPVDTLDRVMPLLREGATAVIASRNCDAAVRAVPQSALRRLGGGAFRMAARGVLPQVADSQCGFKFFSGAVVRSVIAACDVDGFCFDVELLGRLQRSGQRIIEVPVVWTDVSGSTFHPVRHGLRSFSDTVRIRRLLASTPPVGPSTVTRAARPAPARPGTRVQDGLALPRAV